jgi:hypothetical protein
MFWDCYLSKKFSSMLSHSCLMTWDPSATYIGYSKNENNSSFMELNYMLLNHIPFYSTSTVFIVRRKSWGIGRTKAHACAVFQPWAH